MHKVYRCFQRKFVEETRLHERVFFYIKTMKITRYSGNFKTTWEIDFSKKLKFYNINKPSISTIERGICVPVVPSDSNLRDETYFWDSYVDVKVTVGDDSYILDKDNPKEFARLVNNLETLFALNALK